MSKVIPERMTAEIDGDFVVFLIGIRLVKWWKAYRAISAGIAMARMQFELRAAPEDVGYLGGYIGYPAFVQYWRSFEHLEEYARARDREHWPAWVAFNKKFNNSRGDVGIWHETYLVREGEYENVYSGMPPFGLGAVGTLMPATGSRESARERLRASEPAAK